MNMKTVGILAFTASLPTAAQEANLGFEVADSVAQNSWKICSKMGVEAVNCMAGMAVVGSAAALAGTCWQLHQAAELAQQNYGYFKDDLVDMAGDLSKMNKYISKYTPLVNDGSAAAMRTLKSYNIIVIADAKNFMKSVNHALKHERKTNAPTYNPFYGTYCWAVGCPSVPAAVDGELVQIKQDMTQTLPTIETLSVLASNPAGQSEAIKNCNDDLQDDMNSINKASAKLKATMASAASDLALAEDAPSPLANETLDELHGRVSSLKEQLRQQKSSAETAMFFSQVIGFGVPFLGLVAMWRMLFVEEEFDSATTRSLLRADHDHEPLDVQGKPQLCSSHQLFGFIFAVLIMLVCSGIYAWSWEADLQLTNQIASAQRFEALPSSMQASLDAFALCGQNCSSQEIADFSKDMSNQGELALKMMISNAENSLQSLKLV